MTQSLLYPPAILGLVRDAVATELDHDTLAAVDAIEAQERRRAIAVLSGVTFDVGDAIPGGGA